LIEVLEWNHYLELEEEIIMLVLTRKIDESLIIDDCITVQVLSINHGRVKLGITAPKHIRILRNEHLQSKPNHNASREKPIKQKRKLNPLATS
jgi:carbon storage regulator